MAAVLMPIVDNLTFIMNGIGQQNAGASERH